MSTRPNEFVGVMSCAAIAPAGAAVGRKLALSPTSLMSARRACGCGCPSPTGLAAVCAKQMDSEADVNEVSFFSVVATHSCVDLSAFGEPHVGCH